MSLEEESKLLWDLREINASIRVDAENLANKREKCDQILSQLSDSLGEIPFQIMEYRNRFD